MPVSAVLAAVATWGPLGAAVGSLSLFSSFLLRTSVGLGLNILSRSLAKADGGGYNLKGESGSALDHQIVYGRVKVGGVRVYDSTTGEKNKFLHRILAFAGHRISDYEKIFINDEETTLGTRDVYVYKIQRRVQQRPRVRDDNPVSVWDADTLTLELPKTTENLYAVGEYFDTPTIDKLKGETPYSQTVDGVRVVSRVIDQETIATNERFKGVVKVRKYIGTVTQSADPDLIEDTKNLTDGKWTTDHKLSGIAYLYSRFEYDKDAFPNGVPVVSAIVKGALVYDPRDGTTAWSDNPALCILDYLTEPYGLDVPMSRIDLESFKEAAKICDTLVDGEKKYTLNGAFLTSSTPDSILSEMLTSLGGILWYSQGKWRIKAAEWTAPVLSLNEDDLRSNIKLSTRLSRKDLFNQVKGTFSGDETDWQVSDYPVVKHNSALAADNNVVNVLDMPLLYTKTATMARRLAKIALYKNREQLTISASFGARALVLSVGDVVNLSNTRFGWVDKTFEVVGWAFSLDESGVFVVNLTLRETSQQVYDGIPTIAFERNNTTLPNPFYVPPVNISITDELRIVNEQVTGVMIIDTSADDDSLSQVQVQYKSSDDSLWKPVGIGAVGDYEVFNIFDGDYDVRARGINSLGIRGEWSYIVKRYVSPYADPPDDVTDFSGNVVGENLILTWEPSQALDLSHYKIRYSPKTTGATYANSVDLVAKVPRPGVTTTVPARTGTYFIRAFDKLGNGSLSPKNFVVIEDAGDVIPKNVVVTLNEFPNYTGAKSNVVVVTSDPGVTYLTLNGSTLFDAALGDFDSALNLFDGLGGITDYGTYQFSNSIDLGIKQVSYVRVGFDQTLLDYANSFDSFSGLFDNKTGEFDGLEILYDSISVKSQVSTTDDDPAGTPTWSGWRDFVVGQVSARAMRFRIVFTSKEAAIAPSVTNLRAFVDMPDRVVSGQGLTFAGSTTIAFDYPFRVTPAVSIDLANLNSGQYYKITSKTKYGFTVTVYNSNGSVGTNTVTLDYIAKGYGKEI